MFTNQLSQEELKPILQKIYKIISDWNNQKHKFSRKYSFERLAVLDPDLKIPFSILRDNAGNFYLMENDKSKTKAEDRRGSEGRYKLLQQIILDHNTQAVILTDSLIGVKIEKEIKPTSTSHPFFQSASNDPFADIFGNESEEDKYKANPIGALKKLGLYIDDFYIANKHYILQKHISGSQLLKFINTVFVNASPQEQIELLKNILINCVKSIFLIHDAGVIHRDTQLKNFIRSEDGSQCTLIDYGSAILSKDKLKQYEDFLCFKNQFDLIEPHFKNDNVFQEWQNFKIELNRIIDKHEIKLNEIIQIINDFSDLAQKILNENKFSLKG